MTIRNKIRWYIHMVKWHIVDTTVKILFKIVKYLGKIKCQHHIYCFFVDRLADAVKCKGRIADWSTKFVDEIGV